MNLSIATNIVSPDGGKTHYVQVTISENLLMAQFVLPVEQSEDYLAQLGQQVAKSVADWRRAQSGLVVASGLPDRMNGKRAA